MTEFYDYDYDYEENNNTLMFVIIGTVIISVIVYFVLQSKTPVPTTPRPVEKRYLDDCVIGDAASHCPHVYEDKEEPKFINMKILDSSGNLADNYVELDTSNKDQLCSVCQASSEQLEERGQPRGAKNGWPYSIFLKDKTGNFHKVDNAAICDNSWKEDENGNWIPNSESGPVLCAQQLHANREQISTVWVLIIIVIILLAAGILVSIMLDKKEN